MNRLLLDYRCDVDPGSAGRLRKLLQQVLDASVGDRKCHHNILLCLSEIVSNIALHGKPQASYLRLRFEQNRQHWLLRISDDGQTYDPGQHEIRDLSVVDEESEHGRGIALIHACCDRVDYHPGNPDNPNVTVCTWRNNIMSERHSVLIVEDEAVSRRLLAHYLSDDYDTFEAVDGEEALKVLADNDIDLVLSDINMPSMDGLTLRSEITRNPGNELIPFVFITGDEDDDLCGRAASLGIDDYLIKPVSREKLLKHIERVLQRRRQVHDRLCHRINSKISQSYANCTPSDLPYWNIVVERRDTGAGGGDLLLSQPINDGTLLTLVDTMGHDETAKFFSYAYGGFISGMMRSASGSAIRCHELLQQLSQAAFDDELLSKATLTAVAFELGAGGELTLASAAHPQPLLVSAGSIDTIPVEGILPGLLPDSEFTPVHLTLKPGQRVVLFTDGLVESADDTEARALLEHEILTAIKETTDMPLDRASRCIMKVFDDFVGSTPKDDTTFIMIEPNLSQTEAVNAR
jgi:sigma-B regulation protein RsbU (phosphoserine phosphatase)